MVGTKTYLSDILGDGVVEKIAGAVDLICSIVIICFCFNIRIQKYTNFQLKQN
jgi:hypothetical protein